MNEPENNDIFIDFYGNRRRLSETSNMRLVENYFLMRQNSSKLLYEAFEYIGHLSDPYYVKVINKVDLSEEEDAIYTRLLGISSDLAQYFNDPEQALHEFTDYPLILAELKYRDYRLLGRVIR